MKRITTIITSVLVIALLLSSSVFALGPVSYANDAATSGNELGAAVENISSCITDAGELQVVVYADDNIAKYRLYEKSAGAEDFALVDESNFPLLIAQSYNSDSAYAVSVISFDSEESELVEITDIGMARFDYDPTSILADKTFVAGSRATATHSGTLDGVQIHYDYSKLTDGSTAWRDGRFSTVSSHTKQVFDGIVDLGGAYMLNQLTIQDFNGTDTFAGYMGTGLQISVYSHGQWHTIVDLGSNEEILAYRSGTKNLVFDLGGARAEKINIYIPARLDSNTISINEIWCSGIYDPTEYTYVQEQNVLVGKQFVPTADAQAVIHTTAYGYQTLTDNSFSSTAGRFSTSTSTANRDKQHVDATVNLGGTYTLGEIRFHDMNGQTDPNKSNPTYLGTSLTIQAYLNGRWETVLECAQEDYAAHRVSKGTAVSSNYVAFDLGGVIAEQIRIFIPDHCEGSSISIYEIACTGARIKDNYDEAIGEVTNFIEGKEFVPGPDAAPYHGSLGFAQLTDASFRYQDGRFSTKSGTTHIFDASVMFDGDYELTQLRLFDYNSHDANYETLAFAGKDIRIEVLVDGVWVELYSETHEEMKAHRSAKGYSDSTYLGYDLGGIVAQGLRIYQSGGFETNAISYSEIRLLGQKYDLYDDNRANVLAGHTAVSSSPAASSANPLTNLFDSQTKTYAEVNAQSYSITLNLDGSKALNKLTIYENLAGNLIDGKAATASNDTKIEVLYGGKWYPLYTGVSLSNTGITTFDICSTECASVRITFNNTRLFDGESEYRGAKIGEITCTASAMSASLSKLAAALDKLPVSSADLDPNNIHLYNESYAKFKEYAMNVYATESQVNAYLAEIEAYIAENGDAVLTSYNLSLNGDVSMNFYFSVMNDLLAKYPEAHVEFTVPERSGELTTVKQSLKDARLDAQGRYVFTISLPAAQMSDTVAIRFVYDEATASKTYETSIKDYALKVLANDKMEETYPGVFKLLKSMLNYGAYAQTYFNYKTDSLANAGLFTSANDPVLNEDVTDSSRITVEGEANGIKFSGWKIALLSETTAKLYFSLTDLDAENARFILVHPNGAEEEILAVKDGDRYRADVANIGAYNLDKTYAIRAINTADGSYATVNFSVMCYTASVIANSSDAKLVNLVKALKLYSEAANAYVTGPLAVTFQCVDEDGNVLDSTSEAMLLGTEYCYSAPAIAGYYTKDLYVRGEVDSAKVIKITYSAIPENVDASVVAELIPGIVSWGDSLTAGSGSATITSAEANGIDLVSLGSTAKGANYVQVLSSLINGKVASGVNVANCGVGGESSAVISARAMTEDYYLYLGENVTVAPGASAVIDIQQYNPSNGRLGILRQGHGNSINNVTIVGKDAEGNTVTVTGTITMAHKDGLTGSTLYSCDYSDLVYTFTRNDALTETVTLESGAKIVTYGSYAYDGRWCVIFMGQNGGYNDIDQLIDQQQQILDACECDTNYIIIGLSSGTASERAEMEAAMKAHWGDHYFSAREVISSEAAYVQAGFSEDVIAANAALIKEGKISSVFLHDSVHLNAVGYAVLGNAVFERMVDLGYFDALYDYYDSLK